MRPDRRPTITHLIHSLEGGGTERMLLALLKRFDQIRFRHRVVTLREAGELTAELPDHVACRALRIRGVGRMGGVALGVEIRRSRPAILHARNIGSWADAIVARCISPSTRLVLGFHGLEHGGAFTASQVRKIRLGALVGARFCSVSEHGRRLLCDVPGVAPKFSSVLPNGVDLDRFAPVEGSLRWATREALGLARSSFVVGCVGSLTPVKGHITLIDAVAKVASSNRKIDLLLVGEGPSRDAIEAHALKCGIGPCVHLLGHRRDVASLLSAMDAYVCSSEFEGMSNALLEAMAAGLPLVVTDVGDNARLVRANLEGLVVDARSPDALASRLMMLADDPTMRQTFACAARRRAEQFSLDQSVRVYEDFYAALLPANQPRRSPCPKRIRKGEEASLMPQLARGDELRAAYNE